MDARATRTRPAVSAAQLPTQVQLSGNANGSANGCPIQVVQISIDGGGWQSVSIAGSVNAGNGYGQVHMTKYRAGQRLRPIAWCTDPVAVSLQT